MTTMAPMARAGLVAARSRRGLTIAPIRLIVLLVAWLGIDTLLLWRFLGIVPVWTYPAGAVVLALILHAMARGPTITWPTIPARRLAICVAVAALLFVLGGEGRLFYANVDWQVRDAVLHDMIVHPWPFAYDERGVAEILRAPLGMYLLPALAGKTTGQTGADLVLLGQNAVLLGTLLALGGTLFDTARRRRIALATVVGFSGLDILPQLFLMLVRGIPVADHMEWWADVQFSSHVTQIFWVPQHAVAGWIGALLYLLWKENRIGLGVMAAPVPLLALWSPLSAIGLVPFVVHAGLVALMRRRIGRSDVAMPIATTLLAFPSLLYLAAAGDAVGGRLHAISASRYLLFELVEVAPYVAVVLLAAARARFAGATLAIVIAMLMLVPLWQIGYSADFAMRASIPSLLILSLMLADILGGAVAGARQRIAGACLPPLLAIGAMTGIAEIRRGLAHPPAPEPLCSFFGAWDQTFGRYPKSTYLAPLDRMPGLIRPTDPVLVAVRDPRRCWHGDWYRPTGII